MINALFFYSDHVTYKGDFQTAINKPLYVFYPFIWAISVFLIISIWQNLGTPPLYSLVIGKLSSSPWRVPPLAQLAKSVYHPLPNGENLGAPHKSLHPHWDPSIFWGTVAYGSAPPPEQFRQVNFSYCNLNIKCNLCSVDWFKQVLILFVNKMCSALLMSRTVKGADSIQVATCTIPDDL